MTRPAGGNGRADGSSDAAAKPRTVPSMLRIADDLRRSGIASRAREIRTPLILSNRERRAEAFHTLLASLEVLPGRTYIGEPSCDYRAVADFLDSTRTRRAARIMADLEAGGERSGVFIPPRFADTTGRIARYREEDMAVLALSVLWIDGWREDGPRRTDAAAQPFRCVTTRYTPTSRSVAARLSWTPLDGHWDEPRLEILKTLLADGTPLPEAADIAREV